MLSSDGLISDLLITFLIRRLIKRLKSVFQVLVLTCVVMFSYTKTLFHFVSLLTQVYKWAPVNHCKVGGGKGNPAMD